MCCCSCWIAGFSAILQIQEAVRQLRISHPSTKGCSSTLRHQVTKGILHYLLPHGHRRHLEAFRSGIQTKIKLFQSRLRTLSVGLQPDKGAGTLSGSYSARCPVCCHLATNNIWGHYYDGNRRWVWESNGLQGWHTLLGVRHRQRCFFTAPC